MRSSPVSHADGSLKRGPSSFWASASLSVSSCSPEGWRPCISHMAGAHQILLRGNELSGMLCLCFTIHGNAPGAGPPHSLLLVNVTEHFLSPPKGVVSVSLKQRKGPRSAPFSGGAPGRAHAPCGPASDCTFPFGFGESLTRHPEAPPADTKACFARNDSSRPTQCPVPTTLRIDHLLEKTLEEWPCFQ